MTLPHPRLRDEAGDNPELAHAWLVERIAEAWADAGPTGTLVITARCVQCGCTAEFKAGGVPPCRGSQCYEWTAREADEEEEHAP